MQELVLADVAVYRYKDSSEFYSVPEIYLCKELGKFIIESIPMNLGVRRRFNKNKKWGVFRYATANGI
jgi:hypothetical protein